MQLYPAAGLLRAALTCHPGTTPLRGSGLLAPRHSMATVTCSMPSSVYLRVPRKRKFSSQPLKMVHSEKGQKKRITTNTPFRRPSCQAREEKRKFSPTAHSSAAAPPLSTLSHVSCCAAHACRGERKWRPKVRPARQVVHSFSRCLSLLMTAAIVPTVPPLSCSAPSHGLSLSLSLSLSL